ncbi:TetR/AcrR family transcriptional regulator [Sporosarcina sp. Te-1]|uniref:TetR/AcrR family transcriptional regulator n=1 Tax=Sporosarcina sp. Te-1 TaxID=2818390 RepID=UPI001A9D6072|nr:TetR/AcrR family transcriptional regulator [Sporosarcina sp. Te-1]QTD40308.1 TetR/AcrR family transcriptional regulator [Sporosarcina sp. Te-1]
MATIGVDRTPTREKILSAALSLFGEKGYAGTSTREIAERAGVNHITLFRHFGNKENLFQESVISHKTSRDYFPKIEALFTGDIEHDLRVLAKAYFEENIPNKEVTWIFMREIHQDKELEKLFFEYPNNLFRHLENYLTQLHEQGKIPKGNFKYTANFFYSLLSSILIFQLTLPHMNEEINPDIGEMVEEVVNLFTASLYHPRNEER